MTITIFTDGGSLNNPGRAASAYLIFEGETLVHEEGTYIGIASNNVAEYTGLINAFTKLQTLIEAKAISRPEKVNVYADSQLMVNQLNGIYKVKHPDMKDLYMKIKILENELNLPISYTHVLRDKNAKADALVKKALGV